MANKIGLFFGNLKTGDIVPNWITGTSAMFLEVTNYGDIVFSVGGFVIKVHKYDSGQRHHHRFFFAANGNWYYSLGHYARATDSYIEFSVHLLEKEEVYNWKVTSSTQPKFTKNNIHYYYYKNFVCYQQQVDNILKE